MIQTGILNPHLLSLLARVRHTNTLVIADWVFLSWPRVETIGLIRTGDATAYGNVILESV